MSRTPVKGVKITSVLLPHSKCPECLNVWNKALTILKGSNVRNFIVLVTGKSNIDGVFLYLPKLNTLNECIGNKLRGLYPLIRKVNYDVIAKDEVLRDLLSKLMKLLDCRLIITIIISLRSREVCKGVANAINSLVSLLHEDFTIITLANLGISLSEEDARSMLNEIIDNIKKLDIIEEFEFNPYIDVSSLLTLLSYLRLVKSYHIDIEVLSKGSSKLCINSTCIYLNYAGLIFT
ncbi:MAG: hypothetical protein B6U85_01545 [Desulfurococcales archaeon ex4484_42]|nr:MAG: hypothetical protein B6U85_01545 [Desulfurococcales archaeon ex4484_42]